MTALTLDQLIRAIRDVRGRALAPDSRFHGESDAVLRGKIQMLETLADQAGRELPEAESLTLLAELDANDAALAALSH